MLNRLIYIAILLALTLTSCSKGDDDERQTPPVTTPDTLAAKGAKLQIMVVFAPGQLGDLGYADEVMEGIVQMQQQLKTDGVDSIDVDFIALYSFGDTRQRMCIWAARPFNPYSGHDYERRLLVLTEPYMAQWLDDINALLRPTDEVLLLKATSSEAQEAAAKYGSGQRLHALRIDIAPPICRFATYMKDQLSSMPEPYHDNEENKEKSNDDWDDESGNDNNWDITIPDHVRVYVFRQYASSVVQYRDSMTELLRQELGPEAEITELYVDDQLNDQYYTEGAKSSYLEAIYQVTRWLEQQCHDEGFAFIIFDLGMWNTSAVQFMQTAPENIEALLIDATSPHDLPMSSKMKLHYCRGLKEWLYEWCNQPATAMPQNRTLGNDYITDDIPVIIHL
jgi:hypothetical protein